MSPYATRLRNSVSTVVDTRRPHDCGMLLQIERECSAAGSPQYDTALTTVGEAMHLRFADALATISRGIYDRPVADNVALVSLS